MPAIIFKAPPLRAPAVALGHRTQDCLACNCETAAAAGAREWCLGPQLGEGVVSCVDTEELLARCDGGAVHAVLECTPTDYETGQPSLRLLLG